MSNYRRARIRGGTYFFTVVTHNRRSFLTTESARQTLRAAWRAVSTKYPFETDAVCLLPDHLHCIWTLPDGDTDFSRRWNSIKGQFTKGYLGAGGTEGWRSPSRQRKGEAAVWQRRFWEHLIRDDEDLRRHLDYIHFNPVKHGYVQRAAEWPWSSFHRHVRLGWYDEDWGAAEPQSIQGFDCVGE